MTATRRQQFSQVETPAPPRMLVTLTEEQLKRLLAEEVEKGVAKVLAAQGQQPEYRTRQEEARRLGVSLATLGRLCLEGMPYVMVGDHRRFRAADVDAWLRSRDRGNP